MVGAPDSLPPHLERAGTRDVTARIRLPTMLAALIGGERFHDVEAGSVAGALDALTARHPELQVHLFDESNTLRPHVRCFRNDSAVTDLKAPIDDGDSITVLQAVSGGPP